MNNHFNFILEIDKLKNVYRHTLSEAGRNESSAEHSWSVMMIFFILEQDLLNEFHQLDLLKIYKLGLIHDLVEIYSGDVNLFNTSKRAEAKINESQAILKFKELEEQTGTQIINFWKEFEENLTIETKIVNACDLICPMFMRVKNKQDYHELGITKDFLDIKKLPGLRFSRTFLALYDLLIKEITKLKLFAEPDSK